MENKRSYLNLGCGNKYHKDWTNVDITSKSPYVIPHNLQTGIPFSDNQFDVVYHSQFLEHFPKEKAADFLRECLRVLRPGGIMRVVVPDLENIVTEYVRLLRENIENPSDLAAADYDWIMLEMYDQTVRNYCGGQMGRFLQQSIIINEQYISERTGYFWENYKEKRYKHEINNTRPTILTLINDFKEKTIYKIKRIFSSEEKAIGCFRLSGENHMWMYDRYSLSRILHQVGFEAIEIKNPFESGIVGWDEFGLDLKNGIPFDPTSLFMEAKRPL